MTSPQQNRNFTLGDFFQVQSGLNGQAVIVYVDETSNDREADTCGGCGQTPPQAAGPIMVAVQKDIRIGLPP